MEEAADAWKRLKLTVQAAVSLDLKALRCGGLTFKDSFEETHVGALPQPDLEVVA